MMALSLLTGIANVIGFSLLTPRITSSGAQMARNLSLAGRSQRSV